MIVFELILFLKYFNQITRVVLEGKNSKFC